MEEGEAYLAADMADALRATLRYCPVLAAEQGNDRAQFNLGYAYDNGEGVLKGSVQAVSWYRKAAEQGNAGAQFSLGRSYYKGEGVPEDKIEAYAYFNLAGITNEEARRKPASLEEVMSPDAQLLGPQRTQQLQKKIEAKMTAKQAGK